MTNATSDNPLRVLIVDDELPIRRFLSNVLTTDECKVFQAENGSQALAAVAAGRPNLILLDLGLPDMDGVDVIRKIRTWSSVPIIVLSVRGQEGDKVKALDAGADDYLTKPFGINELLARIRVALRRTLPETVGETFRTGQLEVDLSRRRVRVEGHEIQLTPTEFELLRLLVIHAGKVLTHGQLLKQIWGSAHAGQPHVLRVNISNLRHKIEADVARPRYIRTEPGVGYRLWVE